MSEKETQFFRTEEKPKPNGFEKSQEPWIEQIEADNNKVKIGYTGYRRFERFYDQKLKEVDKIEILNNQGEKFDFSSLLPKNWRFCKRITSGQGLSFGLNLLTSHSSKEIWFPDFYFEPDEGKKVETFSQSKDQLGLLHEIGHSFESKKVIVERITTKEKMKKIVSKLAGIEAENFPKEPFTEKEKQDYYQYIIIPERNAWAYALRQYQEIRRQGIDIFPKGTPNQEILKIVRHYLRLSLDAGIGLMEDPLQDPKTIKTKREAVKESRRLKSIWERVRDKIVEEVLSKIYGI